MPAGVRLLGTFDETVVGYRGLRAVTRDGPTNRLLTLPVTSDAQVVGRWRRTTGAKDDGIDVELDRPLDRREQRELRAEAARHAAFQIETAPT